MQNDMSAIQPLLQRSLNLMETAAAWQRKAAKRAHIVGLQGEKRRLRYLSREARNVVDWTEHYSYDSLKLDISAQQGTTDASSLVCIMSTMNGIIEKLWIIYGECHQIANEMVAAKYRVFAQPLYCYCEELFCILAELQRTQREYELADYEYHHISRYQLTWENVHDKYEDKEKDQGYFDYSK